MSMQRIFSTAGICRHTGGTAAIEFALFSPFLAMLVVGMSDLAMALTRKYQIEQASYRALEMMTVGSLQSDYETYIKPEAAAAAGVPPANITVTPRLECNGVQKATFSATCAPANASSGTAAEETARFVTVTITDQYEPMFEYTADLLGGADGKIPLTARSTLRVQ